MRLGGLISGAMIVCGGVSEAAPQLVSQENRQMPSHDPVCLLAYSPYIYIHLPAPDATQEPGTIKLSYEGSVIFVPTSTVIVSSATLATSTPEAILTSDTSASLHYILTWSSLPCPGSPLLFFKLDGFADVLPGNYTLKITINTATFPIIYSITGIKISDGITLIGNASDAPSPSQSSLQYVNSSANSQASPSSATVSCSLSGDRESAPPLLWILTQVLLGLLAIAALKRTAFGTS